MKKKDSWILWVLGIALLFIIAMAAYNQLSDKFLPEQGVMEEPTEEEKYLAPDFIVYDSEGNEVALSDFLGQPVVLNFWASWCGPCKSEMPDFQEVYEEYGEEVQFLMVNLTDGSQETVESASDYIANNGYYSCLRCYNNMLMHLFLFVNIILRHIVFTCKLFML